MNASGLPITQLGSTIKAHLSTGEKHIGKSEEHFKAAGLHLVEAKTRIAAGEYGNFSAFLTKECGCLSVSRAYELIAIANGTKTPEDYRQRAREGMRASRERSAYVAALHEAIAKADMSELQKEEKRAARARSKMALASVRNVTETSMVAMLTQQIATLCNGAAISDLQHVISYLQGAGHIKKETAA